MRKRMNPRIDRKKFRRDVMRGSKDIILYKGLVRGGKRI